MARTRANARVRDTIELEVGVRFRVGVNNRVRIRRKGQAKRSMWSVLRGGSRYASTESQRDVDSGAVPGMA